MKKIKCQLRQGDVLLQPVSTIPQEAKRIQRKKSIVLADGELTGHAHTIDAPLTEVETYEAGGELYLKVNAPQVLSHQEHGELAVEPGLYMVRRQTEVWMDEVRQVAD